MYLKNIIFEVLFMRGIICMIVGFVSALGIRAIHDKIQEAKNEDNCADPEDPSDQGSSETVQG